MFNNPFEKDFAKKRHNFYTIMGIIGDIIFYPVILIALFCCLVLSVDKVANRVPNILGVCVVSISSGSMVDGGFNVGDIVFLTHIEPQELRAGDIIAFYNYSDPTDVEIDEDNATLVQSYDRINDIASTYVLPESTQEKVDIRKDIDEINSNHSVFFHRIVKIFVSDDGTLFFQTQGDSNANPETYLVCENYIVGEYVYTPVWLRGIFSFITTPSGILMLILLPLSILVMFILFSIIEQISNLYTERKVLKGELQFNSKEALKANIGIEMDILEKLKYYSNSTREQRPKIAHFLWGHLKQGKKKDVIKYNQIMYLTQTFEENPKHFWMYWISNTKSDKTKRKIEKLWNEWNLKNNFQKFNQNKK